MVGSLTTAYHCTCLWWRVKLFFNKRAPSVEELQDKIYFYETDS